MITMVAESLLIDVWTKTAAGTYLRFMSPCEGHFFVHKVKAAMPAASNMFIKITKGYLFVFRLQVNLCAIWSNVSTPPLVAL